MVTNEQGMVAMKFRSPGPVVALGMYQFVPHAGLSLAWIHPFDVERLKRKTSCDGCGGNRLFFEASEGEVETWQGSA